MSECQVLRCTNRAARVISYNPPDSLVLEGVVCVEHGNRMDAGEPWAHQEEHAGSRGTGSAFLMDDDLAAAGLVKFTGVGGTNDTVLADRTRPRTMRVQGERYGDGKPVEMRLILTPDAATRLRKYLDMWAPPAEE